MAGVATFGPEAIVGDVVGRSAWMVDGAIDGTECGDVEWVVAIVASGIVGLLGMVELADMVFAGIEKLMARAATTIIFEQYRFAEIKHAVDVVAMLDKRFLKFGCFATHG